MHQPHDVGLVGGERLRQRRLQPDQPGGMHHRVDLLRAAHIEQPREVADLSGAEARGEGRGHAQKVRRRRRDVIGERRVAGGFQRGHRVGAEKARAAGHQDVHEFRAVCRSARLGRQHAHARLHLGRHAIVAHQLPRVAQAERLALHHEQPERVAGLRHQFAPLAPRVRGQLARLGVEVAQRRERCLERAPEPAERRGLLLRDLVVERGGGIVGPDVRAGGGRSCVRAHAARASSLSIAASSFGSSGATCAGKLPTTWPSRPIRYLWKFQRGSSSGFSAAAHL